MASVVSYSNVKVEAFLSHKFIDIVEQKSGKGNIKVRL